MSKTLISLLIVLLLVVGVLGLWWVGALEGLTSVLNLNILGQEQTVEEPPGPEPTPSELTTGSDSSDQALERDTAQLDAQLEAYGETSSALDQGFGDEPIEQDTSF